MTTIAGLTTTYLGSGVLPQGTRQQYAGLLYGAADYYARGGTGTPPTNKRTGRVLYKSERDSVPNQPNLAADFLALTGP
jgi:hypothetical protein